MPSYLILKQLSCRWVAMAGFVFFSHAVQGQAEWHLKKQEDGITVYTKSTPNSNFKTVKVDFNISGSLSQLAAFLLDVEKQTKWIYNSKTTSLVKKVASNEIIYYSEITLPWPCTNRDYVSHVWMNQTASKELTITTHAEPDMVPVKNDKVRVSVSNAHWVITAMDGNMLHVTYIVQFDPAGSLPAWLVNMFLGKAPIQTFKKLREEVNKPEYINARLDFIKE